LKLQAEKSFPQGLRLLIEYTQENILLEGQNKTTYKKSA